MNSLNNIWIIDDDQIARFIIKKNLQNKGFGAEIIEFENAQDALTKLTEKTVAKEVFPDLILLDLNMPKMNAWEYLIHHENLTTKNPIHTKIIMVTSSINAIDKQQAKENNQILGFIEKPFSVEKLNEIIQFSSDITNNI